jgi:phosphopantetheine adenylyltransferase
MPDDTLLRNKKYPDLVEPFADRASAVRDFLSLFRPGIICDIAPLHDVCGPTGWDPDIQGLVVSHETLSGADTST